MAHDDRTQESAPVETGRAAPRPAWRSPVLTVSSVAEHTEIYATDGPDGPVGVGDVP